MSEQFPSSYHLLSPERWLANRALGRQADPTPAQQGLLREIGPEATALMGVVGLSVLFVVGPLFLAGVALGLASQDKGGLQVAAYCLVGPSLCLALYEAGRAAQVWAASRRFKAGQRS
jgi:hypothetical protein